MKMLMTVAILIGCIGCSDSKPHQPPKGGKGKVGVMNSQDRTPHYFEYEYKADQKALDQDQEP